jgi:O-antigen/teichoic acid export membrane protein
MALSLSFVGLATTATGNFEMYLERYAAEFDARGQRLTLRRAQLLALGVKVGLGLVACAVLLALVPMLVRRWSTPELRTLVPILMITVAFDGFSSTGRATLFGLQRFRWVSVLAVVFHVAKTVMVGLLWWSGQGLVALAIGFATLSVALGLAQSAVTFWILRGAQDAEPAAAPESWPHLFRGMWRYCLPLLGGRIAFTSGQNLSKILIGHYFDKATLGYFTFAYQTIERFSEFVNSVPSALLPSFTWLAARGQDERLKIVFDRAHRLVQTLAFVVSLGLFIFAREITRVLGSSLFLPSVPLLRILALVPLARTAQQPLTMLFRSLRRPGTEMALSFVKFVTEFGCYFPLIVVLGIAGAAWSNLAGAVVSYAAAIAVAARFLPAGARERWHFVLTTVSLLLPFLAITLLVDGRYPARLLPLFFFHVALFPLAIVGVFATRMVSRVDLDSLAQLPLESAWSRFARGGLLAVLGIFARLAEPRRAS